ncbi:MAG: ribosome maturation factor RimM [Candidatus Dormiibacterota bacterium]
MTLPSNTPTLVRVAFVRRAVGLRGEVEVEPLTDDEARFRPGLTVHAGRRKLTIEAARPTPRGLLLRLAGVADRDAAEALRGEYLEVDSADVAELPEGSYYHWQLVGLEVETTDGRKLGRLVDVQPYPANDVYVVKDGGAEVLVPAIREVVREVDLDRGRMIVELPSEDEVR